MTDKKTTHPPLSRFDLWVFYGLTLLISWGLLLPDILKTRFQIPTPFLLTVGFGPALSALIMAGRRKGWQGILSLLGRLGIVKVNWQWYGIVLLGPPLLFLTALGLGAALGTSVDLSHPPILSQVGGQVAKPWLLIPPAFLYLILILLGEEIGWRGYALPRLLDTQNELMASLILGLLWGIWHLPMAWTPSLQAGIANLPLGWFIGDILAMSLIYTWVFVNTRGSLMIALLLHTANNLGAMFLPILPPDAPGNEIFFLVMGLKWMGVVALILLKGSSGWKVQM